MNIRIAAPCDITDHHTQRCVVEPSPKDATAQGRKRIDWLGMTNGYRVTIMNGELMPGGLRQARLVHTQSVPIHLIKGGHDFSSTRTHCYTNLCAEPLCLTDRAVRTQENHGLVDSVDAEAARPERRHGTFVGPRLQSVHGRKNFSRCSGMKTLQPSSSLIRRRSVSAACTSP